MKTYVNIKNELITYNNRKIHYYERNHRIKCDKCKSFLKMIYTKQFNKQTKLGYYCELCKIGFLNKSTGKYFEVEMKEIPAKRT